MSRYSIIEVSDICIRAFEDGSQVYAEPGIALLPANATPVLGYAAQKVIQQQPTRIHSRFWSDLSTSPISITQTSMRHGADLIWHQLAQIKDCLSSKEVIFCLPSHLGNEQMQLLAGICDSLELKANYFLNIGLSQLALKENLSDSISHLDLQLHQLVLSRFTHIDGELRLASQETVPGISYLQLIDRMVHALRDQFIHVSRFDPLHSGDTEQQLFDQVAELISSCSLKPIDIKTATQSYRVEPSPKDFEHVVAILEEALAKLIPNTDQRALSPVFSGLPGFKSNESTDINLSIDDCIYGAEKLIAQQSEVSEGILYFSSMKSATNISSKVLEDSDSTKAPKVESANALLYQGKVYPPNRFADLLKLINAPETSVQAKGNSIFAGEEVKVNGSLAQTGQAFAAQDQIIINQAQMIAVSVLE
jgi:hypothetical protein